MIRKIASMIIVLIMNAFSFPINIELLNCPFKIEFYDSNNTLTGQGFLTYDQLKRPIKAVFGTDSVWTVFTQHGDTLYQSYHYSTGPDTDYEKVITPVNGKPTVSWHFDNNNFLDEKDSCIYDAMLRLIKIKITNYGDFSSGDSLVYYYNSSDQITNSKQFGNGELWDITDYQYDTKGRISKVSDRDCDTCKNSNGYDVLMYNDNAIRGMAGRDIFIQTENAVKIMSIGNRVEITVAGEKSWIKSCKVISMDGKKVFQTTAPDNAGTNKLSLQPPNGFGRTNNIVTIILNNGTVINSVVRNKM
jgi:hypothetical protein